MAGEFLFTVPPGKSLTSVISKLHLQQTLKSLRERERERETDRQIDRDREKWRETRWTEKSRKGREKGNN